MQTGMGHHPSASERNADANLSDIWDYAPADGVVVPMTPPIIKRKRKGPLGLTARGSEGEGDECLKGLLPSYNVEHRIKSSDMSRLTIIGNPQLTWNLDKAHSNHPGKVCADVILLSLKPYRGNPTVRDFRGLDGNGT